MFRGKSCISATRTTEPEADFEIINFKFIFGTEEQNYVTNIVGEGWGRERDGGERVMKTFDTVIKWT